MTCRDIEKLLAEGRPVTGEAAQHVRECEGCRALVQAVDHATAALNSYPASRLGASIALPPMTSVKPLAPDAVLVSMTTVAFAIFCVIVAALFGFAGFVGLTLPQRLVYYGTVILFGLLFSMASVQAAIPGAKVRVRRSLLMGGAVLVLAFLVAGLFPDFSLNRFVVHGIPCLRLGCVSAAVFGLLAAIPLRRGYVTDIRSTSLLLGCFAGFSGVAVLALHCPLQNALHIIVWHLGAIAVSAAGGYGIGSLLLRKQ